MKTLIINGSPRTTGDSTALINEVAMNLKGEIFHFNVYSERVSPCIDCRYCWENQGCSIDDKMTEVFDLLDSVDNVVLASPLHFSEITGELLNFASRLQTVYAQRNIRNNKNYGFKNKNGLLILVGGGDKITQPAEDRVNIIFRLMNVTKIDHVFSLDTNDLAAKDDVRALFQAKKVAEKLNNLYRE